MAGSEPDNGVHVLLVSYPAQGHINPLVQFGKRLAAAHHDVRCTLAVARSVLGSGCQPPCAFRIAVFSDGCDLGGYNEVGDVHTYLSQLE
ncbi:unnamed protein product [Urochloa humidicola]